MQWKIARSSRLSDRFNRWAMRRGFPLLAWLAPRAPRWCAVRRRALDHLAGHVSCYAKPKRAIARNLARVMRRPPGSRRGARGGAADALPLRLLLGRPLPLRAARRRKRPAPRSKGGGLASISTLRAARRRRRVILLTAHLGNWELGGVLARAGRRAAVGGLRARRFRRRRGLPQPPALARPASRRSRSVPRRASPACRCCAPSRRAASWRCRAIATSTTAACASPFFGAPAPVPGGAVPPRAHRPVRRSWPAFIAYTPRVTASGSSSSEPIEVERARRIATGDVQRGASRAGCAVLETRGATLADAVVQLLRLLERARLRVRRAGERGRRAPRPGTGGRAVSRAPEVATAAGVLPWARPAIRALDRLLPGQRSPGRSSSASARGATSCAAPRPSPGRRFLGVEIARRVLPLAAARLARRGLANLALVRGEALYLLAVVLPRGFAAARARLLPRPLAEVAPPAAPPVRRRVGRSRARRARARTAGSSSPPTTSTTALKWRRSCAPRRPRGGRRRRMAGGTAHQLRGEVRRRGPPDPAPRGAAGGAAHARPARRCRAARRRGRVGLRVLPSRSGVVASRGAMRRLLRLVPYLRRYRAAVASGIASILAAAALGLAAPWLVGRAIDALLESGRGELGAALARYALLLVGSPPCRGSSASCSGGSWSPLARHRVRPAQRLLRPPRAARAGLLPAQPPGDLMARGHQRPGGGADALRSGDHVRDQHGVRPPSGALVFMVWIHRR